MPEIDFPGVKETLWHQMQDDLRSLVPWFIDHGHDLLLCPGCLRRMTIDDFSLEHFIPKQALAHDPKAVRDSIIRNQRSGLTLPCKKPLFLREKKLNGNGCNGWKGLHFDTFVGEVLHGHPSRTILTSRHQIAMFAIGYLALFREYGYRVSLSPSGLLMRRQFFQPNSFLNEIPLNCQMMLFAEPVTELSNQNKSYWDEPFKIMIRDSSAFLVIRSMSFRIPLLDDPTIPIARILRYVPQRFKFSTDLKSMFDERTR
jgi:hypothetical protein